MLQTQSNLPQLPRAQRRAFVESLHRSLGAGAVIVALDNRYVEGSRAPISHVDADGDYYQRRRLADGSEHTVLKNFPSEAELVSEIGGEGVAIEYTALDFYWLLKYELTAA